MSETKDNRFVILFVCTGNTCRSPMAEAALRVLLEKQRPGLTQVGSAGISAVDGFSATDHALEAVKLWSGSLREHRSRRLTVDLIEEADLIFGMTTTHAREVVDLDEEAADKTYLFKNFPDSALVGDGVEDPIGGSLDQYNETFVEIGEYLGQYLGEIVKRIDEKQSE